MRIDLVRAPNPGVMTGPGTNTWIVSDAGEAIVIDPGPVIPSHLDAVEAAVVGLVVVAVLVTHGHDDHAPAANPLAVRLGKPVVGPAAGAGFRPDRLIADGDRIRFGTRELVAMATPGHTPDSTCYRVDGALFTGDHIMGGSTVMVEEMSDYMASLQVVLDSRPVTIHPGHGDVIADPAAVVGQYLAHRRDREAQIVAAIRAGAVTVAEVVAVVYAAVDPALHPAASVSVDAHLCKLAADGVVVYRGGGWNAPVEMIPLGARSSLWSDRKSVG